MQWWKRPGADMGRYRQPVPLPVPARAVPQRRGGAAPRCPPPPRSTGPTSAPAIGDRTRPMRRGDAGADRRRAGPLRPPHHPGSRRARLAAPAAPCLAGHAPLTTQTATADKALACPPLLVPAGGTWRGHGTRAPGRSPSRWRPAPCGKTTAIAVPPFVTVHRGSTGDTRSVPVSAPVTAVTASGNHLGLAVPDAAMIMRNNTPRGDPGQMPPRPPSRSAR